MLSTLRISIVRQFQSLPVSSYYEFKALSLTFEKSALYHLGRLANYCLLQFCSIIMMKRNSKNILSYQTLSQSTVLKNSSKESACQFRRHGFNPWIGKISWRRKWQLTPVLFPGKFLWTEESDRLQSRGLQTVGYIND